MCASCVLVPKFLLYLDPDRTVALFSRRTSCLNRHQILQQTFRVTGSINQPYIVCFVSAIVTIYWPREPSGQHYPQIIDVTEQGLKKDAGSMPTVVVGPELQTHTNKCYAVCLKSAVCLVALFLICGNHLAQARTMGGIDK